MFTNRKSIDNLNAPRNIEVGRGNPFKVGDKRQSKAVFFCPSFLAQLNFEPCEFIMKVLFGQPLRSVAPSSDSANSFNTVTRFLAGLRVGSTHSILGIAA
jgi:hypothetical protein